MTANKSTSSSSCSVCVSPEWLKAQLDANNDVCVLDATWYMPNWKKIEMADYKLQRIPGSKFFHIDGIADHSSDLPHMLPSPQSFSAAMDALGITNDSTVVLYDQIGIFSAPRAWWTFLAMGHDPSKVRILEGGLPAWKDLTFPLEQGDITEDVIMAATRAAQQPPTQTTYQANFMADKVRNLADMLANIQSQQETVLDARSAGRFKGTDPEPRPGLPSGHIPGSTSLPFTETLVDGNRYKPVSELRKLLDTAGVDASAPVAVTCGSGLTACIVAAAVYQVSGQLAALYDGAWTEWASNGSTPRVSEAGE